MVQIVHGNLPIHTINIDALLGDATGFIHIKSGQSFYVEFDEFSNRRSSPPCNFIVDEGADIWLSQDFRVIGKHNPAFQLNGHLSGVYNLTLAHNRRMVIGNEATNARYISGKFVYSNEGKYFCS